MNRGLVVAAALCTAVAAAHSLLGERFVLTRLFRRAELPKLFGGTAFTQATLRFAWHVTSVAWLGFAALLLALAGPQPPSAKGVALVVAATFAVTGLVALLGSRGRHLSWIVFFAIALLAATAF